MASRSRLCMGALFLLIAPVFAAEAPRQVLILQSFGHGFEPHNLFSRTFQGELARLSGEPVVFHEVSLPMGVDAGAGESAMVAYLQAQDAAVGFDLMVAVGAPATRFVQRHRAGMPSGAPLLVAGTERRNVYETDLEDRDGVIPIAIDLAGAFEHMITVLPDTSRVAIVIGRSPLERFWLEEIRRAAAVMAGRAEVVYLDDLPFERVLEGAAEQKPGTAIFFPLMLVDATGVPYGGVEALGALRAVANAPVFGLFDYQLGQGIVGGPLVPVRDVSREAARLALGMLRDGTSGHRPPAAGMSAPAYDARELTRWNIDPSRLPAGATILYRQPTFWEAHRWQLLSIAAVCVAQALLIAGLLVHRARWRSTRERLRKSNERYEAAVDGTNDGIWDWQLDTGAMFYSPRCLALLGCDEGAATAGVAAWHERIHPDDRPGVAAAIRAHVEGETAELRVEHRLCLGGGEERWLLARGKARRDAAGRPRRLAGSLSDLSERRAADEAVRTLSRRLVSAQETERARLARELHDDVSQRLARLAIDAGRIEAGLVGRPEAPAVRGVHEGLARLGEDVHALSYRLHPSVIEDLGLAEALQVECDRFFEQSAIPVDFEVRDLPAEIPNGVSLCAYRVAQEALRNVERHAEAREVAMLLAGYDGGIRLTVRDDGIGFDPETARRQAGLGLESMRERIHMFSGTLELDSRSGGGTAVRAFIPLRGAHP